MISKLIEITFAKQIHTSPPMILKKFLFLLFVLPPLHSLFGQRITVAVTVQYGSYRMKDLQDLQNEQASTIYDSLKTRTNVLYAFPAYSGGQLSVGYTKQRRYFHFTAAYNATGGRLSYEDYSGKIKIDKRIEGYSVALGYGYSVFDTGKLKVYPFLSMGATYSKLTTENLVEIYVSSEKTFVSNTYSSLQFFLKPELMLECYLTKSIFIGGSVGYFQQLSATSQKDQNGTRLTGKNNNDVHADWSGLRIGAGIGIQINRTE